MVAEDRILTDREWLLKLASLLEGEGMEAGPVQFSEEFAQMLAGRLRAIAEGWDGGEWVRLKPLAEGRDGEWIRTKPEVEYDLDGVWEEGDGGDDISGM